LTGAGRPGDVGIEGGSLVHRGHDAARAELRGFAEEQAALRRVAVLLSRAFDAVFQATGTTILRTAVQVPA